MFVSLTPAMKANLKQYGSLFLLALLIIVSNVCAGGPTQVEYSLLKITQLSRFSLGCKRHCTGGGSCWKTYNKCCYSVIFFTKCSNKDYSGCMGPNCGPWPLVCRSGHCQASGGCYRSCQRCCRNNQNCIVQRCSSTCYDPGCRTIKENCVTNSCALQSGCYRRCRKCCRGSSCRYTSCTSACYTSSSCSAVRLSPTPSPKTVCTGSYCRKNRGCYEKCRRCCTGARCEVRGCLKVCYADSNCGTVSTPTPIPTVFPPGAVGPEMYKCSWSCLRKGRCLQLCRKCCKGRNCINTHHCFGKCENKPCPVAPQQLPICLWECLQRGSCYTRCRCCCLNGQCRNTKLCQRACFAKGCGMTWR